MERASATLRLAAFLSLALPPTMSHASRLRGPVGSGAKIAGTIVVADTARGGERGRQTVLHVREVIKGDLKLRGKSIVIPSLPNSSADPFVPPDKAGQDLRDMRDPRNFDLIPRFFRELPISCQRQLVALLGQMDDLRGVPILIEALGAEDKNLSSRAAWALARSYLGAPGVTEAFQKALQRPHLAQSAAEYLAKRLPGPEIEQRLQGHHDPWRQAQRLLSRGTSKRRASSGARSSRTQEPPQTSEWAQLPGSSPMRRQRCASTSAKSSFRS